MTYSKSSNTEKDLLKIQQEREKDLLKIRQERANDLLKIQQERERESCSKWHIIIITTMTIQSRLQRLVQAVQAVSRA